MSDISELEQRILAAMDRVGKAVQSFDANSGASDSEEAVRTATARIAQLEEALEAERTASSQLRERVDAMKALKERQQTRIDELESKLSSTREARDADRAELDGLLSQLEVLVQEVPHA